jgi:hypothetical protein
MSGTITKQAFNAALKDKSIDVKAAESDARLSGVDVRSSDLNKDGQVSGENETSKLFSQIDKFDRNGDANSVAASVRGRSTPVAAKLEAVGDLANVEALRALANTGSPGNNDVVLLGMNKGSSHEAQSLRNRGVNVNHVKDAPTDDTIRTGGRTYDLSQTSGVDGFVKTLGLPEAQSTKIADVINSAEPDAKDELAQLSQIWAKGEKGGEIPSRLVLSGHSVGDGVWGDDNGEVTRGNIADLAKAMPRAAKQVEDLHISGCYSGGERDVDKWRGIFPKAKTVWAYTGSAPGSYSGATTHLARWDRATRGAHSKLDRDVAANTRKGENVATWSTDEGYADGRPARPLQQVRSQYTRSQPVYEQFFNGSRSVTNTQSGPLREHYNDIQRLVQHRDLPSAERDQLATQRDKTIRLIYYSKNVAPKFQNHHQDAIKNGYEAMGMPAPDFSKLSRSDAMTQISLFEDKIKNSDAPPAAAQSLLPLLSGGLRDLNSSIIPATWI